VVDLGKRAASHPTRCSQATTGRKASPYMGRLLAYGTTGENGTVRPRTREQR
jgi:hypothetical protein